MNLNDFITKFVPLIVGQTINKKVQLKQNNQDIKKTCNSLLWIVYSIEAYKLLLFFGGCF